MILDANTVPAGSSLQADVCVVGAGAAGISLALTLQEAGIDVLLLESGGDQAEPRTQALYAGSVADEAMHSPLDRYRERRFGGSTTIWGGRCMPYDAIDFEKRPHIAHSGWPIGLDALLPYYEAANRLCEAGDFAYTAETAFSTPRRPLIEGFTNQDFSSNTLERFSCPTDFGARYRQRLIDGACRVVQQANVGAIELDAAQRQVDQLQVRTLTGNAFTVRARRFVLAAGGLETARLLLASPGASGLGVGNRHDVVGRYYQCHLAGTIGSLSFADRRGVYHGYEVSDEGIYCRRRLALRPAAQQRLGTGNFVARLHHPRITDPAHHTGILSLLYLAKAVIPYEYGKRLHGEEKLAGGQWLAHLRNVIIDAPATAVFLAHWLRYRTFAARKFPSVIVYPRRPRYSLDFHAEQEPNPDSRVQLSEARDELGMRRLHVDWRYTPRDLQTVQASLAALASELRASGVGNFDYDPAEVEHEMTRYGAYGGHHIGTARMGTDPASSVVDADCRVHELDNLYVSGSAVFPTSSQANPTLTIVAMALRLGEHLKRSP
jgi:choline dehydrogenase-like flavoprotein